jgi:hypothetical protein
MFAPWRLRACRVAHVRHSAVRFSVRRCRFACHFSTRPVPQRATSPRVTANAAGHVPAVSRLAKFALSLGRQLARDRDSDARFLNRVKRLSTRVFRPMAGVSVVRWRDPGQSPGPIRDERHGVRRAVADGQGAANGGTGELTAVTTLSRNLRRATPRASHAARRSARFVRGSIATLGRYAVPRQRKLFWTRGSTRACARAA